MPSAVNSRVPSVSPSAWPASTTRTSRPGMWLEPLDHRGARRFGLLRAVAEILARALVDDDDGDRSERIAVLAGQRRIGERQHDQRQRQRADRGAAAARHEQQQHRARRPRRTAAHNPGSATSGANATPRFMVSTPMYGRGRRASTPEFVDRASPHHVCFARRRDNDAIGRIVRRRARQLARACKNLDGQLAVSPAAILSSGLPKPIRHRQGERQYGSCAPDWRFPKR